MDKITLRELNMSSRNEILEFMKKLWRNESTDCPVCGTALEPLHKKAKKSDCDWQCRKCEKVFRTIHLLDELNREMPD